MMKETKISRQLISENDSIEMIANEREIKKYEDETGIQFSAEQKENILVGQIEDYITFEIFCHLLKIKHKPKKYFNNLVLYGLYLESKICNRGLVIVSKTLTENITKNQIYIKGPIEKNGEHIMIAVPENYMDLSDYQKMSLKYIREENDVDLNVYRYPNKASYSDGYLERLSVTKFYNDIEKKKFKQRIKSIFK